MRFHRVAVKPGLSHPASIHREDGRGRVEVGDGRGLQ